jgi:hypothetical protein
MALTEKAIGLEQIQIISPYGPVQLTDFRISSKPNQHARVSFSGMVDATQKDSCVAKATTQDKIEINLVEAGQKVRTLFKGVVAKITVKNVRGIYYLEVEALSNTYLLDIKLKNRSFQNLQLSYNELFQTEADRKRLIPIRFKTRTNENFSNQWPQLPCADRTGPA